MSVKLMKVSLSELKFTFELEKKSSCPVYLVNTSDHYVAFKVKTTSPKRYSVRPNISIIRPKLTCEVIVTLEAQSVALPDTQCKDKFLIQSTIVPFGTTDEAVTPSMFNKDDGKYIEEHKLRVVLTAPTCSPSEPVIGNPDQELGYETPILKHLPSTGIKDLSSPVLYTAEDKELKLTKDVRELKLPKDVKDLKKDVENLMIPCGRNEVTLANDIEDLKLRMDSLDMKLHEVNMKITRLKSETSITNRERQILDLQREMLRRSDGVKQDQEGFSIASVGLMGLCGIVFGYLL